MAPSSPDSFRTSGDSKSDPQPFDTEEELKSQPGSGRTSIHKRSQSLEPLNENSPLLSPAQGEDIENLIQSEAQGRPDNLLDWNEGDEEQSKSVLYLILLTLSIGGLQIAWGAEMSNGSPYLLALGMNKSMLAFVWIAAPLSGVLVQPYIGIRSDNSRNPWGKRKPFMLWGAVATGLSFLTLAWTREIVHGFLGIFGADPNSEGVKVSSILFAVVLVYILDVAINAVQAAIRAFIVDNAPTHQQEDANAWAGRITGVGSIIAYLSGFVDLPKRTGGVFGNTQFKVLCVIAAFAICSTVLVSIVFIKERDPRSEGPASSEKIGVLSFFRQLFASTKRLPPQIRKVCEAQFFNWMGWFPFLYYITTYIGQLHVNSYFAANPDLSPDEIDKAWERATRVGSFALLIFAITSFASILILPYMVVPTYRPPQTLEPSSSIQASNSYHHIQTSSPGTPVAMSTSITSYFPSPEGHSRLSRLLSACQVPGLTLRRAWMLSQLLLALCMLTTFFISSTTAATVLAGFIGIPWALTLWVPFALISAEISKRDTEARRSGAGEANQDQAGVILGLHNVAASAPQMIASLVSSAIFKATQKPRGSAGDDSVGWVLRFGGVAALIASYMIYRVGEEGGAGRDKARGEEGESEA